MSNAEKYPKAWKYFEKNARYLCESNYYIIHPTERTPIFEDTVTGLFDFVKEIFYPNEKDETN